MYIIYTTLLSVIAPEIFCHILVKDSSLEASRKASELADFYLGGYSNIKQENFNIIMDMFTNTFATYLVECFIEYAQKTQNVYQYCYVHKGKYNIMRQKMHLLK